MFKKLVIFLSIILFTLQNVSSNSESNSETNEESVVSDNQMTETNANSFRRILSNLPGIRLGRVGGTGSREDIETLRQVIQSSPNLEWQQFTAPPVVEPNCYVEVQVTQRMPGKCTKLGGRIPACQARDLVTIDYNSCK